MDAIDGTDCLWFSLSRKVPIARTCGYLGRIRITVSAIR